MLADESQQLGERSLTATIHHGGHGEKNTEKTRRKNEVFVVHYFTAVLRAVSVFLRVLRGELLL
jgi:hypothetical protein